MSAPFARSIALMAAMGAMVQAGLSHTFAAVKSGADAYRSRGKGRGDKMTKGTARRSGRSYPFSSTKQDARTTARQHMVVVAGFQLMQTRKAADARSAA